jgi:hypothetical protein
MFLHYLTIDISKYLFRTHFLPTLLPPRHCLPVSLSWCSYWDVIEMKLGGTIVAPRRDIRNEKGANRTSHEHIEYVRGAHYPQAKRINSILKVGFAFLHSAHVLELIVIA